MSCASLNTTPDLKAYVAGELPRRERSAAEDHVRECLDCREELERLQLTWSALGALEDEEIPRRIAFVSDRVFEPRWWQTMWRSGPVMGFASAVLLAAAILAHGIVRPAAVAAGPPVDAAQIERQVESRVSVRVDQAVAKAVNEAQAKQSAEFAKVLSATESRFELQRRFDLATFQQAAQYYEKQMGRFTVASNEGPAR